MHMLRVKGWAKGRALKEKCRLLRLEGNPRPSGLPGPSLCRPLGHSHLSLCVFWPDQLLP